MNENLTVSEKIALGHYKPTMEWPRKPATPAVLSKKAVDLTAEEIYNLLKAKAEYEAANLQYEADRKTYNDQIANGETLFREDLEKEHGVVGHPKAGKLYSIAWDMGHSAGLNEVESYYSTLVELL